MNENMTWDLEIMYKGHNDPKYKSDFKALKKKIEEVKKLTSNNKLDDLAFVEGYLKLDEEIEALISELYSYNGLRLAVNTNDNKAQSEESKIDYMLQELVLPEVELKKRLKDLDLDECAKKSNIIKDYLFNLKNIKEEAKHMLSDKEEVMASKFEMVASDSWSYLQDQLTSNLLVKVKGKKMPLSEVRNLAYDNDKDVRFNAYKAELKAYKQIDTSIAMALNNIKREVNIMDDLRGYKDAIEKTLSQSNMTKASLDALIEALKEEQENFRRYFKLKAQALGYENGLPFYELFAPMGKLTKTYTFEEAKDLVLDVYKSFSNSLYEMGKDAFENRWIDVYPKAGKQGGAFCAGIDNHKQSRVLTNFTGSLGDVQTLAHELGHAYHGKVCLENKILNRDYPMQLAETASIFCQTLMAKKMINELDDPFEKLTVVEESLQEDSQCVVDILSRFLFEKSVLETPIEQPLNAKDMCKMMLKAQDQTYGDGLDKKYRHPYMWLCKGHYYSAGLNYYNWPYAFGLLYAKGLYKKYLDDKAGFVAKYDEMLKNTALMNVEEVAATMGVDITKKDFWLSSLKFIEEDIDLFEKLLKETKMI